MWCDECGAELPKGSAFCESCGHKLASEQGQESPSGTSNIQRAVKWFMQDKKRLAIIALAALLLAAALIVVFSSLAEQSESIAGVELGESDIQSGEDNVVQHTLNPQEQRVQEGLDMYNASNNVDGISTLAQEGSIVRATADWIIEDGSEFFVVTAHTSGGVFGDRLWFVVKSPEWDDFGRWEMLWPEELAAHGVLFERSLAHLESGHPIIITSDNSASLARY